MNNSDTVMGLLAPALEFELGSDFTGSDRALKDHGGARAQSSLAEG